MTKPLTPPNCDLRDFHFMPLDVVRLRDSDLAGMESPEACWAAVLLWCASWHQIPAASLPDDDRVLANLSGFGRVVKEWQKVKVGALRGWIKCSDGRLYHPVVAEKANDAFYSKLEQGWRTECARIKKHNQRHEGDSESQLTVPTLESYLSTRQITLRPEHVPKDIPESPKGVHCETTSNRQGEGQRQGYGEGQRQEDKKAESQNHSDAGKPASAQKSKSSLPNQELQDACRDTWSAYSQAYLTRYGTVPVRNAKVSGQIKLFVQRIGREESPGVAAFYVSHNEKFYVQKSHPVDLMLKDAEGLRTQWATNKQMTGTRAGQIDKSQTNHDAVGEALRIIEKGAAHEATT